jgi:hypothetical protein
MKSAYTAGCTVVYLQRARFWSSVQGCLLIIGDCESMRGAEVVCNDDRSVSAY